MDDLGAQVVPPIFIHQSLTSRYSDLPSIPKKRPLSYHQGQLHPHTWNPKAWDWDSSKFLTKPSNLNNTTPDDHDDTLRLNLGGRYVEDPVSKPPKKVRPGSPASVTYPMCQVDNCKEDLSNAKDYHRRHKVCELHSKSSKALVVKQMQRFCQQCSRFHPLSEFDDGKRSCRRRLAGHNWRRRKTQPEDVTSRLTRPGSRGPPSTGNLDIVSLLTVLARAQGKNEDQSVKSLLSANSDQLIQILNKINSLPLPADLAAKLPNLENFKGKAPPQSSLQHQNKLNGNPSSPSTMDLLTVLSATLAASAPDALAMLSQKSSVSSDSEKTRSSCPSGSDLQNRPLELPSVGGERSSTSYQSPMEDSDGQVQGTRVGLPLQLFGSSPEHDAPPNLTASRKYFSSDSSNPIEERSPSSSPPLLQTLFPVQSTEETTSNGKMPIRKEVNGVEVRKPPSSNIPFELFRELDGARPNSFQTIPYQAGYTSSGSDHSPSSLNSDAQDRTGRISFKLFDKDPSQFPGTLRTQIYNWLSNCPSEMESYIRPGCVVLSVYMSMSSIAWEQLEENLVLHLKSLVHSEELDFWRSGRFLVYTGRQLASHKDGKIHLNKSSKAWSNPELTLVSPLAVVSGQKTSFLLRGRNLKIPGTRIHCTSMGGYISEEVMGLSSHGIYDEIHSRSFKVGDVSPTTLGRCFIEVENGFRGNSFPVIIADATICRELRHLESDFDEFKVPDISSESSSYVSSQPRLRDEILQFLNELGWLFQRERSSYELDNPDFLIRRFRFLLTFSAERDFCALVKTLLDILAKKCLITDGLSMKSLEMISEIQLLNRSVKRRCRRMVDLLVHYHVSGFGDAEKKYLFPPNFIGPGGITPLHLAASMADADDLVDALTNDPLEIGLECWSSQLDESGRSPQAYALMRGNHTCNELVKRKLGDKKNGQVSVRIGNEIEQLEVSSGERGRVKGRSCSRCAVVAARCNRRVPGSGTHRLLHRPYIHSMLAIAAVCVCVCLFLRGSPDIGLVAPFKWENLGYGTI
ncbi:squamosa promoter-binding-like protein 14 [Cucumis melo var. makuwa]|uniref:Squamosa promoter-binding-like protein 14 n=1 Tax=Cucumis melo var. makuwa TaxID=1194695 RepID=A0A5D3D8L7_CUCMM|nr:squamosa promoter-binding-like protein 14 [Cucumis melo var. makuwa]TYK19911.1 squamosa promoter-binding-like protein 14 [Cucumis melo var. makuwa]